MEKARPKSTDLDNPDKVYVVPANVRDDMPSAYDLAEFDISNGADIDHVWSFQDVTFVTATFKGSPKDKYVYVASTQDLNAAVNKWGFGTIS